MGLIEFIIVYEAFLVVTLHLYRCHLPPKLFAGVLPMLRATLLVRKEVFECSPGVQVDPETPLAQQTFQPCLILVR